MERSTAFSFNKADMLKTLRDFAIVAVVSYGSSFVRDQPDLGLPEFLQGLFYALIVGGWRYLKDNTEAGKSVKTEVK